MSKITKPKLSHIAVGVVGACVMYLITTVPQILVNIVGLWNSPLGRVAWWRALGQSLLAPLSTYDPISFGLVITNSLLAGAAISGILHLKAKASRSNVAGGLTLSIVGAGCASCGSLLIGPTLAGLGGASLFAILPFHGAELLVLSTILLSYGAWNTWRQAWAQTTCQV